MPRKQPKSPSKPQLHIEYWPVSHLAPYERNARKNDKAVERMRQSIREYGFTVPVLAQSDGLVIDGHLRLKGAIAESITEVPVIPCDGWTDAQVKAFRLMANRSVAWADWDLDALALEFGDLKDAGFDLNLTGFDSREIDGFTLQANAAEDDVPPVPEVPITKSGDLWVMGGHRLLCGDSTNAEDVARLMAGAKADLVFTDPPYNVGLGMETPSQAKARNRRTDGLIVENDSMADGSFREFLAKFFTEAHLATKLGAAIYVCHSDTEGLNFRSAMIESGWLLKQVLVWVKQTLVMGRQDYHWQHEPILYGWKPGASHRWEGDRKQSTIWNIDRPFNSKLHPTMKPVELIERAIVNSSKSGDVVLDPFGGSGSTLIACHKTSREARLIEIDPGYCDVIVKRWETISGKRAVLESAG